MTHLICKLRERVFSRSWPFQKNINRNCYVIQDGRIFQVVTFSLLDDSSVSDLSSVSPSGDRPCCHNHRPYESGRPGDSGNPAEAGPAYFSLIYSVAMLALFEECMYLIKSLFYYCEHFTHLLIKVICEVIWKRQSSVPCGNLEQYQR